VRELALEGESLEGVMGAVDFIEQVRQADDLATVPVGRRVVVIGGGNTAVDAAVQSRKLGAASVTMVYRRGVESMSATWAERDFAQTNGVTLITHATPLRLIGENGVVTGVEFERSFNTGDAERFVIEADMVLKAIGQTLVPAGIARELLTLDGGRIAVDANGQTSLAGVWAGGDCAATGGIDLTVQAVQDGKLAAEAIHAQVARADIKAA
ncbi:FAD-dependent oxidoreductase, partial [Paraburkholderia graminis]|uniref:FAD-dependent oxidoreductase n=1 Tax=Paraburkholderia graminis TaxID=60548 RepID=UPI003899C4A7